MSQFRSVCGLILAAGMLTAGVCDSSSSDPAPAPVPGVIQSEFQARYVAFYSRATDLVPGFTTSGRYHVYVRNLTTNTTARINGIGGAEPNWNSYFPTMSADGRFVAFHSGASNLVAGDTNGMDDVFVHDLSSGQTERVNVTTAGGQATGGGSANAFMSADGRFVAFDSFANNLVVGDTNGTWDVFVRDRFGGTTERVSVSTAGAQGNNYSWVPQISADGRFVAFESAASTLVAGDTNSSTDVFVRDRSLGTTERASVNDAGQQATGGYSYAADISADGRFVAFHSVATNLVAGDTNGVMDVFVRDRVAGTTERVSVTTGGGQANPGPSPDTGSYNPSLSSDGRFVAFNSSAPNLVANDTNSTMDVFVRDRVAGTTERVSMSASGVQGDGNSYWPDISPDGGFVAFHSYAKNLVDGVVEVYSYRDIYIRNRVAGTTALVSANEFGSAANWDSVAPNLSVGLSLTGPHLAFYTSDASLVPGDTNGVDDAFIQDLDTGTIRLVSVNNAGVQGDANSQRPSLSADGRFVAFQSAATNLVSGDTNLKTDVFVRDRLLGITERVSVSTAGVQGDADSGFPSISADGRYVAFTSGATNFATTTAGRAHVYVRDRYARTTTLISVDTTGGEGDNHSSENTDNVAAISADGRFVVFASLATDLVVGDTNGFRDI
ncbi:MAG: PD40 domain-containing protein, partial [Planctomycetes bacterium]|nr:PD40 domain-containing protein [Planctomycetota bacterium]